MSQYPSLLVKCAQIVGISTAFLGAGGIATLSLFDVPLLRSQPGERSLPMTRWLFSRGSHIFPQVAFVSSTSFVYLAYNAIPQGDRAFLAAIRASCQGGKASFYLAAAVLTLGIAPFTTFVMIPTNFALIQKNEDKGGARSDRSANFGANGGRTAEDSVSGENDVNELSDVSGPQERTIKDTDRKDDDEVRALLSRFSKLNTVRAVLMGLGGFVGLIAALSF
ncbi:hypothetical protein B0J11DRAFT_533031 [Dendryphion nanum]|uniref:DUF1772-domain-containing protein n=1 Tax=Dendryphion nanum TaxID=256645 RepID=A0A9P9DKR7_9PLEO|nr:hypothetical protein B0J11DRAFT_533031 [Dendryphion nanum]